MAANATLMPSQYNTSLDNYMPQLPAITASGTGFDALGIYFLTVCLAVIFVGALFGNFIVIGTLKRSWHNTVSKTGNYLVFLLALSDFLNALLNMPFICVSIIAQDWIFPPVFCKISGFFLTFLTTTSNNLLCMISLNRYYMVLAPNVHERISKRRSHRMGLYSWVHGFVIALSIVVGWGKYGFEQGVDIACIPHWDTSAKSLSNMFFVWLCAFVIPISIMVITYFRLFRLVRMRSRRVCPKHPYKTSTLTCPELANAGPSRQSTPQIPAVFAVNKDSGSLYLQNRKESMFPGNGGAQQYDMESRTAITLLIVLGIFAVCWLPQMVVNFVRTFQGGAVSSAAQSIAVLLFLLNSACNPIVYSLRNASFRAEAKELVCGCEASAAVAAVSVVNTAARN